MKNKMEFILPQELRHPFFFPENENIIADPEVLITINSAIPFLYEAAYFSGIQALKPWEIQEQSIPNLLCEWQNIRKRLEGIFAKREAAQAIPLMKKGIALFLQFIYWANGLPVILNNRVESSQFPIKPVNLSDRLNFLIQRPSLFHSFIQLNELMTETNKHYEKALALKKASKHEA